MVLLDSLQPVLEVTFQIDVQEASALRNSVAEYLWSVEQGRAQVQLEHGFTAARWPRNHDELSLADQPMDERDCRGLGLYIGAGEQSKFPCLLGQLRRFVGIAFHLPIVWLRFWQARFQQFMVGVRHIVLDDTWSLSLG